MYICTTFLLLDWGFSTFIGAQKISGKWQWQGRVTEPLAYDWWGDNQPSGGEDQDCLNVGKAVQFKFNNVYCQNILYFFCEKASNS